MSMSIGEWAKECFGLSGCGWVVTVWPGGLHRDAERHPQVTCVREDADRAGGVATVAENVAREGGVTWIVADVDRAPGAADVRGVHAPMHLRDKMAASGVCFTVARLVAAARSHAESSPAGPDGDSPVRDPIPVRMAKAELLSQYLIAAQATSLPITKAMADNPTPPPGTPTWGIPGPLLTEAQASATESLIPSLTPALDAIRFSQADREKHRGKGVLVAVLDTGCATNHKAFSHGRVKCLDATGTNPSGRDANGHGTWCCGAINGEVIGEGGTGFRGVAPDAHLLSIQVLTAGGWGTDQMISRGVDLAVAAEVDVISMSLGGSSPMPLSEAAIRRARSAGILVVAAAGNDGPGPNTIGYPGKLADCVCVTATSGQDGTTPARFSSRGPEADLAAPGVELWGPHPSGGWSMLSGTSMATPIAAGSLAVVIGRILEQIPDTEPSGNLALDAVLGTAFPIPQASRPDSMGKGVVRLSAALQDVNADPGPTPEPTPGPAVVVYDRDQFAKPDELAELLGDLTRRMLSKDTFTVKPVG